jgi:hypothetical protein
MRPLPALLALSLWGVCKNWHILAPFSFDIWVFVRVSPEVDENKYTK